MGKPSIADGGLVLVTGAPEVFEVDPGSAGPEREFTVEARSQWRTILHRFTRHRLAMFSAGLLLFMVLFAFVGPLVWKYDYRLIPKNGPISQPPSWEHPMGTDGLGRDMMAQIMRGTQKSLEIAFIVAMMATTIGVVVGAISGYYRKWIDGVLMRFVDVMLTIPVIVIAAALSGHVAGGQWWLLAVILGLISWTGISRIVRGEFLSLREKEFVEAATAVGAPARRIIFRHILPNATGSIIVNATLVIAGAILAETALSYLGLGVKAPDTSLGLLISDNQAAFKTRPWLFWFPGLCILAITLSVNFIGDGLRDAFDPRQNRVRA